MDNWLTVLVRESNGRAFTEDEAERVADYAESLPDRLAAAARVEEAQKWLTRHLGDAVARRAAEWALPREPLAQDFVRAINPVVMAMVLDDPNVLTADVVRPFAGLAAALDVPPADVADLFGSAWQALSSRLDPKSAKLLAPYFDRLTAELAAAEPATILVG